MSNFPLATLRSRTKSNSHPGHFGDIPTPLSSAIQWTAADARSHRCRVSQEVQEERSRGTYTAWNSRGLLVLSVAVHREVKGVTETAMARRRGFDCVFSVGSGVENVEVKCARGSRSRCFGGRKAAPRLPRCPRATVGEPVPSCEDLMNDSRGAPRSRAGLCDPRPPFSPRLACTSWKREGGGG